MRTRVACAVGVGALAIVTAGAPLPARASGYDTPMLYSARHMGMGGTAIAAVEDPSALFHNPAGLARIGRVGAIADVSLLLARIKGSPSRMALDRQSEQTVAPMFLLGVGHRLADWLVAGVGVYPIASAGATYKYDLGGFAVEDTTRLVFIEASPAVALDLLDKRLRLGAGYRLTFVNLERFTGVPGMGGTDFKLSGTNAVGFRLGAQASPTEWLALGLAYRHKTATTVKNDSGRALNIQFTDVSTEFVLPSKLGGGARVDVADVGLALDLEYLFNGQNEGSPLSGTTVPPIDSAQMPERLDVGNVFEWKNALTLRAGVEYRLLAPPEGSARKPLALRLGYVLDGTSTNPRYPSAFGTPPGPTHVLTAGAGLRLGRWQGSLAYARRFGEGMVTAEDIAMTPDRKVCQFCGQAGQEPYRIGVHGLYVDVSFQID